MSEAYVTIISEIDVLIERADGKMKPIRLPGGTLGVYEKGVTLIIRAPPRTETDDAWDRISKEMHQMTPDTRKYVAEKLEKIIEGANQDGHPDDCDWEEVSRSEYDTILPLDILSKFKRIRFRVLSSSEEAED